MQTLDGCRLHRIIARSHHAAALPAMASNGRCRLLPWRLVVVHGPLASELGRARGYGAGAQGENPQPRKAPCPCACGGADGSASGVWPDLGGYLKGAYEGHVQIWRLGKHTGMAFGRHNGSGIWYMSRMAELRHMQGCPPD